MRDIIDTVAGHSIFGPTSCVAWGVEFILKVHDKRDLNDNRIQEAYPEGLGFDDRFKSILTTESIYPNDELLGFDPFIEKCRQESRKNCPVVFSFPSGFMFDFENDECGWSVAKHCFCAAEIEGKLVFLTRIYGNPLPVYLQVPHLRRYYEVYRTMEKLAVKPSDEGIHCLSYKMAS